jgi:hypothetical protein
MTELELLDTIGEGTVEFCRDQFPNLDEIDRVLRQLAEMGYIEKVVRAVYPVRSAGRRVMTAYIPRGLTALGEFRRRQLQ